MSQAVESPDHRDGAAIHAQLLRGEAAATAVAFETYYPGLVACLQRRFPRLADPQLAEDAAAQALCSYFQRPEQYDPTLRGLRGFLEMAARRDLLNLLEREKRHATVPLDDVELHNLLRNNPVEEAVEAMAANERTADVQRHLIALAPDPAERRVLELMRDGVRANGPYAAALGVTDLPELEQRRRVKQAKDRLKKRLGRARLSPSEGHG